MLQTKVVEKIKTYILCSVTQPPPTPPPAKIVPFLENMETYVNSQRGHRWQYNTAHAHFMLCTSGYKHTLTICNTHCFSIATMVTRKHLIVTSYVHCPVYALCKITSFPLFHNAIIILLLTRNSKHKVQSLLYYSIDLQANKTWTPITLTDHIQVSLLTCPRTR